MNILFCCDPLNKRLVDSDWKKEYQLAKKNNFNVIIMDYDNFINDPTDSQFRDHRPANTIETVVYRGWMMPVAAYAKLYDALLKLNLKLINSPAQFQHCYYLPDSYSRIKNVTPDSVWTCSDQIPTDEELRSLLKDFGGKAIILKDYVKSQKHYWHEACFIPRANDINSVKKVMQNFKQKQGSGFQGGFVFREFIDLQPIGFHPKSHMPLTQEYRLFILNKKMIDCSEYWSSEEYQHHKLPDFTQFETVFKSIDSHFFTVDIAKKTNGGWIIIELGDAQVAEYLGNDEGLNDFYQTISSNS
jgi:hypothetical protein